MAPGGSTLQPLDPQAETLLEGGSGTLYKLDSSGSVFALPAGTMTWPTDPVNQPGQEIQAVFADSSGALIDAIDTQGDYWQFDGTTWTLLSLPQFVISPASSSVAPIKSVAGGTVAVTVTVENVVNNVTYIATGYMGTLTLATSDGAAR